MRIGISIGIPQDQGGGGTFSPAKLGNLAAWFRFGQGITVTGSGVSQWDDASGNGRHLKQGTDTNRPAKQGDGSILFDGVDNYLKCDAFTLVQPETVYFLGKQVTWTNGEHVFDGDANASGRLLQLTTTPSISINAGSSAAANTNWTLNTNMAVCCVFNGASSVLRVNNTTETTGDPGAANMGGFTLGASGAMLSWSNIQVKEVIIYSVAHTAAQRAAVISYLLGL